MDTLTRALLSPLMVQAISCMIYACALETTIASNVSFLHETTIQLFPFYFRMYCTTLFAMPWYDLLSNKYIAIKKPPHMNIDYFLCWYIVYPYCIFTSTDTFLALFGLQTSRFQSQLQFLIPSGVFVATLVNFLTDSLVLERLETLCLELKQLIRPHPTVVFVEA